MKVTEDLKKYSGTKGVPYYVVGDANSHFGQTKAFFHRSIT